jgi:PadR family transcriptional regulator, regulatory protein PadR
MGEAHAFGTLSPSPLPGAPSFAFFAKGGIPRAFPQACCGPEAEQPADAAAFSMREGAISSLQSNLLAGTGTIPQLPLDIQVKWRSTWIPSEKESHSGDQFELELRHHLSGPLPAEQHGWTRASWSKTENNREAKYYAITKAGLKGLEEETACSRQMSGVVEKLLAQEQ